MWRGFFLQQLGSDNSWCINGATILHLKVGQKILHIFGMSDQNATRILLYLYAKKIIHLFKITHLKFTDHSILKLIYHSIKGASKNNIINIQANNKEVAPFNFCVQCAFY